MRKYTKPMAQKLEFNYNENVTASNTNVISHGDVGHGVGMGGGCDHTPGHGNPKSDHPVFGNGCD